MEKAACIWGGFFLRRMHTYTKALYYANYSTFEQSSAVSYFHASSVTNYKHCHHCHMGIYGIIVMFLIKETRITQLFQQKQTKLKKMAIKSATKETLTGIETAIFEQRKLKRVGALHFSMLLLSTENIFKWQGSKQNLLKHDNNNLYVFTKARERGKCIMYVYDFFLLRLKMYAHFAIIV